MSYFLPDIVRSSNLSIRARRLFYRLGVTSLDDVCKYTESQLRVHKNVGDVTILRIKQWLRSHNRELAPAVSKAAALKDELTILLGQLAASQAECDRLIKQIRKVVTQELPCT